MKVELTNDVFCSIAFPNMSFLIEKTDDSVILGDSLEHAYLVLFAVQCEEPSHLGEALGVQQAPRERSRVCAAGNRGHLTLPSPAAVHTSSSFETNAQGVEDYCFRSCRTLARVASFSLDILLTHSL